MLALLSRQSTSLFAAFIRPTRKTNPDTLLLSLCYMFVNVPDLKVNDRTKKAFTFVQEAKASNARLLYITQQVPGQKHM
jgi:hypothetical protein